MEATLMHLTGNDPRLAEELIAALSTLLICTGNPLSSQQIYGYSSIYTQIYSP